MPSTPQAGRTAKSCSHARPARAVWQAAAFRVLCNTQQLPSRAGVNSDKLPAWDEQTGTSVPAMVPWSLFLIPPGGQQSPGRHVSWLALRWVGSEVRSDLSFSFSTLLLCIPGTKKNFSKEKNAARKDSSELFSNPDLSRAEAFSLADTRRQKCLSDQ